MSRLWRLLQLGTTGRLLYPISPAENCPPSGSGVPQPPDLATKAGLCPICPSRSLYQVPVANPAHDCQELYGSPGPPFSCACRLPFTIFQGGMPRASYGDRHCISVVHGGQQTAFDFTSRIIDFTVLTEADPEAGRRALGVGGAGQVQK